MLLPPGHLLLLHHRVSANLFSHLLPSRGMVYSLDVSATASLIRVVAVGNPEILIVCFASNGTATLDIIGQACKHPPSVS